MKMLLVSLFSLLVVGCATTSNQSIGKASQKNVDNFLADNMKAAKSIISPLEGTVDKKGDQVIITLKGDRSFSHDSADIRPESRQLLKQLASMIISHPESRIFIAGHTDSIGSEEYNRELSTRRAQSVSDLLAKNGVSETRLGGYGFGETMPIADNSESLGRQANRRIEVRVTPRFDLL
ncbi:OmpA family protein [Photobacterium sanctipauli]|uniref:OmpA family protein n=1 Tax=Photobacterium sanctipauli TaxID=1342794 RepID=A0A2T3NYX2_9GAMM|nr:OmpA family protein [Photobacterium sanctipauli]PSW21473.1 OmpA family protein [Photobacterium sanctipauli]